jgi:hypothetical protein
LLDLATKHSTKSHPNYALIDDLRRRLRLSNSTHLHTPNRVSSDDTTNYTSSTSDGSPSNRTIGTTTTVASPGPTTPKAAPKSSNRKRKETANDDVKSMIDNTQAQANLLLQFSRQTHDDIKNFASV